MAGPLKLNSWNRNIATLVLIDPLAMAYNFVRRCPGINLGMVA
jgi:hypothetical protein